MLTYKIFLNTDMTIRDVISSGNLVQYSWNNISVNVYIPKAIYETSPSISNTVSMTFTQTKENGDTVITNNARLYEFSYVKDNVMVNNIEYVLLTRQMPQQMTLYFGNTQKFQINHLVISDNELISFAQSNLYTYEVFQASNTQEIHDEPSTADELQAEINRLKSRVNQVETHKQDKANIDIHVRTDSAVSDDPNHFTTNVTVGLNVLSVRTDDLEIDNKKNKEDIEDIKSTMTSQFTPLGKLDGNTSEPTLEQINAWLSAQGITQLELGDLITYVGHVSGAVDTNYNCLYTKNGWIWYETTSLETASNTEMGIVKGNGNNTNANEVIDIQNGEIQGIKVKNLTGTQRYLKGYINELEDKQNKILDGTTVVPKANNSQNDGLGNNIQDTYQTKVIGASKQYVKDYALAKMFNEMNYINFSTESNTIEPTYSGGTKTLTISNIGDIKLFDAYYKTTAYEYELSQNNVFSISLPIMLNVSKTAKIKVVVKCDDNATDTTDTPFVIGTIESDNISFVANQVYKVDIQGTFAPLTQPITITPTKQLVVEVYIFNTDLQAFEVNVYNTLSQPSTFTLTIPYQTIQIIEGGAIGQQYLHNVCNYNATATPTLGVGWVFDIDTELVNNTEHKFIARIDETSHKNAFIRVASGGVEIPVIATFEAGFESQPYYNQDHRKFIYSVDENFSIIMFSAFYTNGQFIIVEPNDIDYAKTRDIDDIMNGVLTVGRAKADENGNNIVNTYATKNEVATTYATKAENAKSLYHLGAYDTYVKNDDRITTIYRKTGFVNLGKLDWELVNNNWISTSKITYAWHVTECICSKYPTTYYIDSVDYGIRIDNSFTKIMIHDKDTLTMSASAFKLKLQGVWLQYRLNQTNTEEILTNQPLNTLDNQGSQWVREEFEKTLNLLNLPDVAQKTVNGITYKVDNGTITLLTGTSTSSSDKTIATFRLPAGTYYFKSFGEYGDNNTYYSWIYFGPYVSPTEIRSYAPRQVVLTRETEVKYGYHVENGVSVSNIQFNDVFVKINTANDINKYLQYYIPYKGNVVHEKDIQNFVSEQDIQNFLPKLKHFYLEGVWIDGHSSFQMYFSLQLKYNEEITTAAELFSKLAINQPVIPCSGYCWRNNKVYTITGMRGVNDTKVVFFGFNLDATALGDIDYTWETNLTDVRQLVVYEL